MNPLEQYISIIHTRQQNPLPKDQYGERHHIIPRSCGGCNEEWNLVKLTPEEHYRCHYLLPFIYVEGDQHDKLLHAWHNMSCRRGEDVTVGEYARLRREWAALHSRMTKGVRLSKETRERMSAAHKGKPTHWNKGRTPWNKGKTGIYSEEHIEHLRQCRKQRVGWHHSEEAKAKMSQSAKGHRNALGCHRSEETRRKMSEAKKAYWAKRKAAAG